LVSYFIHDQTVIWPDRLSNKILYKKV